MESARGRKTTKARIMRTASSASCSWYRLDGLLDSERQEAMAPLIGVKHARVETDACIQVLKGSSTKSPSILSIRHALTYPIQDLFLLRVRNLGYRDISGEQSTVARLRTPPVDPVVGLLRMTKSTGSNTATPMFSSTGRPSCRWTFKIYGLGVKVDFFDFAVGAHHGGGTPEKNRERSIGLQPPTLILWMLERLYLSPLGLTFLMTHKSTPNRTL